MKNLIILLIAAAVILFAWTWFHLDYYPKLLAANWVEELRLGIDGGVLNKTFGYTPPLSERELTIPTGGIGNGYKLDLESKPGFMDPPDSRVIRYRVSFDRSDQARPGPAERLTYRLILEDKGENRILPDWHVTEFRPVGSRPLRHRPPALPRATPR
jgi:hypothetical protein